MNAPGPETFEDVKLVLLSPIGSMALALAIGAVLAALAFAIWSYRRRSWRVILTLGLLRGAVLGTVLLVVLQPAVQLRSVTRLPNRIAVLLDTSESMGIRENAGLPSRLERARAVLARSGGRLAGWSRGRAIDYFRFDETLEPIGAPKEAQRARGIATRTRAALAALRDRYRGDDLAGVVLLSDGNDNGRFGTGRLSTPSIKFLERFKAPVHTVWIGRRQLRDVAVTAIDADDFAFVRNAIKVEAEITVQGVAAAEIPVTLTRGEGRVVARATVAVRPDRTLYRVTFEFVPDRVGKYVFTVSTPVYQGEALTDNNRRSFVLNVIRDRIRVLQICGRPSWDERFLRRLLKRDPNVDLISFFILRTPASVSLEPTSELALIPFPTEELFERELGSFDLIVLQNFNFGPYGIGAYLPHIRRYVLQGGGLAMLGGDLSFSSGGYPGTPVASVLPVRLLPAKLGPERLIHSGDFRPKLTRRGVDHPILQIGPARRETDRLWAQLSPLAGVNRVAGLARRSTALAVHPSLRTDDGRPMPVLATREVGKGRTLALTTDSSWHWAFEAVGAGGTRDGYDRFWRNTVRWLIRDPELKYLRIVAERPSVRLGQPVALVIRAYKPDYSPASALKVDYRITPVAGGQGVARSASTDASGELRVEYQPTATGAYRVTARATIGERPTTEQELLLVEAAGPELRDARATPALLEQLARGTRGRYLGPTDVLPELEFRPPRVLHVNWRRDIELWNRWWWLLGALALLALEWLVRRRHGYL